MSITVIPLTAIQSGEQSTDSASFQREFTVISTTAITQDQACNASGVPALYAPYSSTAPSVILKRKRAEPQDAQHKTYVVVCDYERTANASESYESNTVYDDPCYEYADVDGDTVQYIVEPLFAYQAGDKPGNPTKPIELPGTHERLPEAAQKTQSMFVLKVAFNTRSFNPSSHWGKVDTVNDGRYSIAGFTIPAKLGKLTKISWKKQRDARDRVFYRVNYEFEILGNGWHWKPKQEGYYHVVDGKVSRRMILKYKLDPETGTYSTTEVKAEIAPTPRPVDDEGVASNLAAKEMDFQIYWESTWSGLPKPIKF